MTDGITFIPTASPQMQTGTPSAMPASDGINFTPTGAPASGQTQAAQGGGMLSTATNIAGGALNFINNNPVSKSLTSLAALPVQLIAKSLGQPDPYANGIGTGPGAAHVTSSDQPLNKFAEEEAGNALTAGSLFVPVGDIAGAAGATASKLAPFAPRLAGAAARVGTQAAFGAGMGLAGGMQQGQNADELKSSATTGALLGGGLAAAGELGSAIVDNFAANTPESRLLAQKDRLKTLQNAYADSKTDPVATLTDTGLVSKLKVIDGKVNTEDVESALDNLQGGVNQEARQIVKGMTGTVPLDDFKAQVEDQIKNNATIRGSGGMTRALSKIESMFDDYKQSYGDNLSYQNINEIRTSMNRYFDPETVDVERAVGNAARDALYDANTGSPALKSVMAQWGQLEDARNFTEKLRGTAVRGGRLGKYLADMTGAGVGAAVGSALGPFGTGAGAAAGGVAADKVMGAYQKSFFNPTLTGSASNLSRFIAAPTTQAIGRIAKPLIISGAVQQ